MTPEQAPDESPAEPEATASNSRPDVSPTPMGQEMRGEGVKPMDMCPMAEMCKGMMLGFPYDDFSQYPSGLPAPTL